MPNKLYALFRSLGVLFLFLFFQVNRSCEVKVGIVELYGMLLVRQSMSCKKEKLVFNIIFDP